MKVRVIVIALLIISLTPTLIEMIKFDFRWAMLWSNETRVWAAIFSILAFSAVVISFKNKRTNPKLLVISLILLIVVLMPPVHDIAKLGIGASSKEDSETLDLMGYWKNL